MRERIPVHIITGFVGSGKTSLVEKLMPDGSSGDATIVIREFHEANLDNKLLLHGNKEIVILSSGCLCCSTRGDLSAALLDLADKRRAGDIPPFLRVIVETTGLADMGPIVSSLANDEKIRSQFSLGTVLTVVDTQNALQNRDQVKVWTNQVAVADLIWFSKTDLVTRETAERVGRVTRRVNPFAEAVMQPGAISLGALLECRQSHTDRTAWPFIQDPRANSETSNFSSDELVLLEKLQDISSFRLDLYKKIDWVVFGVWLSLVLHRHGGKLLRVKGLLELNVVDKPVVIHGFQHTLFPPEQVDKTYTDDVSPHLIFIIRGISEKTLRSSLSGFLNGFPVL